MRGVQRELKMFTIEIELNLLRDLCMILRLVLMEVANRCLCAVLGTV